jgi:cysteinyl-tRNA synthetase
MGKRKPSQRGGKRRFGWASGVGLNKKEGDVDHAEEEEGEKSFDEREIQRLTDEREVARAEGDYDRADEIR